MPITVHPVLEIAEIISPGMLLPTTAAAATGSTATPTAAASPGLVVTAGPLVSALPGLVVTVKLLGLPLLGFLLLGLPLFIHLRLTLGRLAFFGFPAFLGPAVPAFIGFAVYITVPVRVDVVSALVCSPGFVTIAG